MPYSLFLKKKQQQNLNFSSAANNRWPFKGNYKSADDHKSMHAKMKNLFYVYHHMSWLTF